MELGEKLRLARLEAGLSQRQLCGEEITRNMLSLIENGAASPSMKTLQYLASRLGKSVSYFLEETAVVSANQQTMENARRTFDAGDFEAAASWLDDYQAPDAVYDREMTLLWILTHIALAEQAIREGRQMYALELLNRADRKSAYCSQELNRRRLLVLGQLRHQQVAHWLPSLDQELLLRARDALAKRNPERAEHLLEAMENHRPPRWQLLRGEVCFQKEDYSAALRYYQAAEAAFPEETAPKLEICFRELGDYKSAYDYACRQKR